MKRFWKNLAHGDLWVKGSCLVMGLGCLRRGQIVKGLFYLAAEVLYFLFFFGFGLDAGSLTSFASFSICLTESPSLAALTARSTCFC